MNCLATSFYIQILAMARRNANRTKYVAFRASPTYQSAVQRYAFRSIVPEPESAYVEPPQPRSRVGPRLLFFPQLQSRPALVALEPTGNPSPRQPKLPSIYVSGINRLVT